MPKRKSIKKKPKKPYPEYSLFAHNNGQRVRKIRGKIYSFDIWEDPKAALKKHNQQYAFLIAGVTPSVTYDGWRVDELINEYLSIQEERLRVGEIGERFLRECTTSAN